MTKKYTFDITTVLSNNLKSRSSVHDLLLYLTNTGEKDIVIDFSNVSYATRSFVDEFYIVFLKKAPNNFSVSLSNVSHDIQVLFEIVSKPVSFDKREKAANASVMKFSSVDELSKYFSSLNF